MKYFLDTEFIEHTGGIDLVSIGIVCEDGREFYAESCDFDPRDASPWVRTNVLSKLEFWGKWAKDEPNPILFNVKGVEAIYGDEGHIKQGLLRFFGYIQTVPRTVPVNPSGNIEIYAYFADYDWVVFCRLFGRMIDLPKGMPMWCIDLKQMMWERQLDSDWKQRVCPDPEGEHNALVDARWNKKLYEELGKYQR